MPLVKLLSAGTPGAQQQAAWHTFVQPLRIDGIDLDFEDNEALGYHVVQPQYDGVALVVALSKALAALRAAALAAREKKGENDPLPVAAPP